MPLSSPRWKELLENALADYPAENVFSLASLEIQGTSFTPRVRFHIFRDFMTSTSKPNFPMLLTSTDIRSPKVGQFLRNNSVEQAWWFSGPKLQFRISSRVYVLPQLGHQLYNQFVNNLSSPGSVTDNCGMAGFKNLSQKKWEEKRVGLFKSMPPALKATWARAEAPGSVLSSDAVSGCSGSEKWPPTVDANDNHRSAGDNWHLALSNFAMVILDPISVDVLDMSVHPNRRFDFQKWDGGWVEQ